MIIELCKGKTKCSDCKDQMRKGDMRGKLGAGYFNDPFRYICLDCLKKNHPIPIKQLISAYKKKIKEYNKKIKALMQLRENI